MDSHGYQPPKELVEWLENNKEILVKYPNHYLLVTLPKGIVAVGTTMAELYDKVYELSAHPEAFTAEELKQPCFIVNTVAVASKEYDPLIYTDRSKWGQA